MVYSQKKSVMTERLLLDALERVINYSADFTVLYVNISKLRPQNKKPKFIKIFFRLFDNIVRNSQSKLFILSNGDFVLLGRSVSETVVEDVVKKLEMVLSSDPIVYDGGDEFYDIFNLSKKYKILYEKIANIMNSDDKDIFSKDDENQVKDIEPEDLDDIINTTRHLDLSPFVCRQSAIRLKNQTYNEVVFQEFFTSIFDLSKIVAPNVNVFSNKWLFQHLTTLLDKKMIDTLIDAKFDHLPKVVSLNFNLSTVFSREFISFAKSFLINGQKIVIEVQLMDVFNNLNLYFEARDLLRKGGHKILIDGVDPNILKFLDIKYLAPDMVKLFWEPLLEADIKNSEIANLCDAIGSDNIILARCDNEKAIRWGLSQGIVTFQGYFIDDISTRVRKANCSYDCPFEECAKRKKVMFAAKRDECLDKNMLDKY